MFKVFDIDGGKSQEVSWSSLDSERATYSYFHQPLSCFCGVCTFEEAAPLPARNTVSWPRLTFGDLQLCGGDCCCQPHVHRYRMLMFVTYPAAKQSEALKFQGIFRRAFPAEEGRQWQLRVENSYGCTSDSIHIVQALKRITDTGGRLVSMALAGSISTQLSWQRFLMVGEMEEECEYPYWSDSVNKTSANQVGVNLFYEMPPSGGGGGPYIYQVVPCPISSQLNLGIPRHNWVSTIPWETVISQYLGSGWKLVEIFEDHAASKNTNVQKMFSFNIRLQNNLLWIFEKPASRRDDPTPLYECTMVETWKVNAVDYDGVFTNVGVSTNLSTNWDPLLDHYGRSGWQVVRIIDTPDAQRQGLRLREGFVEDGFGNPSYLRPDAPPAYDEVHAAPSPEYE
ncbi:hypothetical protein MAR_010805 [Mya arenaria]|uniref:Uncharacterized protein n=1 Tax=Mya arenaria TaxID=6604 RepID=A0ABY7FWJ2_MYAAR|nr:hypothetical protein MAR_010805 [Mya arenaria]